MSTIERFWKKTSFDSGFIVWTGGRNNQGYGMFGIKVNDKWSMQSAHRWIYQTVLGDVGDNVIMHSCDRPNCVALQHLSAGTQTMNMQDCRKKKRRTYEQGEDHARAKLTDQDVADIRSRSQSGETGVLLANSYNVGRGWIRAILQGRKRCP